MTLTSLLEKIVGRQAQRERARVASYQDTVRRIADGEEPDADDLDRVLSEAGKSLDHLKAGVELLQRRRELRAQLDELPALAAERKDIEAQLATAARELEAAEQRHAAVVKPLLGRRSDIIQANFAADRARKELTDTCADEALCRQVADVTAKLKAAHARVGELRDAISDNRERAKTDRAEADRRTDELAKRRWLATAETREKIAARAERELPDAEKALAALQEQEKALREQMLVP